MHLARALLAVSATYVRVLTQIAPHSLESHGCKGLTSCQNHQKTKVVLWYLLINLLQSSLMFSFCPFNHLFSKPLINLFSASCSMAPQGLIRIECDPFHQGLEARVGGGRSVNEPIWGISWNNCNQFYHVELILLDGGAGQKRPRRKNNQWFES